MVYLASLLSLSHSIFSSHNWEWALSWAHYKNNSPWKWPSYRGTGNKLCLNYSKLCRRRLFSRGRREILDVTIMTAARRTHPYLGGGVGFIWGKFYRTSSYYFHNDPLSRAQRGSFHWCTVNVFLTSRKQREEEITLSVIHASIFCFRCNSYQNGTILEMIKSSQMLDLVQTQAVVSE